MIRTAAPKAVLRSLATPCRPTHRFVHNASSINMKAPLRQTSLVSQRSIPLAITSYRAQTALVRSYASGAVRGTTALPELEEEASKRIIRAEPEIVSSTSTVHPIFHEVAKPDTEQEPDMMAGVRHDLKVIGETFALQEVPTEAYRVGLAGVLPYLATSTATVACALEINTAEHYGSGYVLSEYTAEHLLHFLEPIQVGYGAVIISFLGAIHWGLEWAGFGGQGGYRRYAIGVIAPAIAWPTIFMPVEYALITQFLAFNVLYAVDSTTTKKGWTPPWYSTYRFVLTAVVGVSIVISLVGRGQIKDKIGDYPAPTQKFLEIQRHHEAEVSGEAKEGQEESEDDE